MNSNDFVPMLFIFGMLVIATVTGYGLGYYSSPRPAGIVSTLKVMGLTICEDRKVTQ